MPWRHNAQVGQIRRTGSKLLSREVVALCVLLMALRPIIHMICTMLLIDKHDGRLYVTPFGNLQLTLELIRLVPLDQNTTVGIRIHRQPIQGVQLTRSVEHVFINLSILSTQ